MIRGPRGTTILLAIALVVPFVRVAVEAIHRGAPMDLPVVDLVRHGAVWDGAAWWRHATSIVQHGGLLHLLLALVSLVVVGPFVEEHHGRWMLPPLFVAFGVVASIGGVALGAADPVLVGASGAEMGLVGCVAGVGQRIGGAGIRRGVTLRNEMLLWSVFVFFFGFVVGADAASQLVGFVAGGAVGLAVPPRWFRTPAGARVAAALGALGLLALAAAVWAAAWPLTG